MISLLPNPWMSGRPGCAPTAMLRFLHSRTVCCMIRGSLILSVNRHVLDVVLCSPGMEATCYIGMIDQRDQLLIRPAFEIAVSFTKVDVDFHGVFAGRHRECLVREFISSPVTKFCPPTAQIRCVLPSYNRSVMGRAIVVIRTPHLKSAQMTSTRSTVTNHNIALQRANTIGPWITHWRARSCHCRHGGFVR